jgi:hypothetical protein
VSTSSDLEHQVSVTRDTGAVKREPPGGTTAPESPRARIDGRLASIVHPR